MRVFLLNPPSPPESTVDRRQRCTVKSPTNWVHPPIVLAYLASVLQEWNKAEVFLLDAVVENLGLEEVKKEVKRFSPDLIISSTGSYTTNHDLGILSKIKAKFPQVKTTAFGDFIIAFTQEVLRNNPELDFGILGEPEFAASQLVEHLEKKRKIEKVTNIAYRKQNQIRINPTGIIEDLDKIPFPDRSLLKNEKYHSIPFFSDLFTDLITSKGCPYQCKFCTTKRFWGSKYRVRSPKNILAEVKECVEKFGIKNFFIPDDTYTANKKWVGELDRGYKSLGVKWALQTRVDLVDKKLLKEMADSGCVYIHYGAESGSQRILDYYQKNLKVDQIKKAFDWTREAGIESCVTFIIGCPIETKGTAEKTIKLAKAIKADYYHFSPLIPHPLTDFYFEFKEKNLLKHEDFPLYVKPNIVFKPKYMTEKEIQLMLKKAFQETTFTPSYILRKLRRIIQKRDFGSLKMYLNGAIWTFRIFLKGRK